MSETAPSVKTVGERVNAQSAATAVTGAAVAEAPFKGKVTGASLTADAAITGNNGNKRTLTVVNRGADGAGSTVVATLDFVTGKDAAAGDEVAFALSGTPANVEVEAGDILAVAEAVTGSGLANPGALIQIEFTRG